MVNDDLKKLIDYDYQGISHHTPMPLSSRAAQFSPFAALNGYEEAIEEAKRLTSPRVTLSEDMAQIIDERLRILKDQFPTQPDATISYFVPDPDKEGGAYETKSGRVKRIDETTGCLVFTDGTKILIADIMDIKGDLFET